MRLSKGRLEAFSDGVIAIIITIMVLSIPLPSEPTLEGVVELLGNVGVYALSFVVVGAFWLQHHQVLTDAGEMSRRFIGYNLLFLFLLSLVPLMTNWVISNPGHMVPLVGYDAVYVLVNLSYMLIFNYIVKHSDAEAMREIRAFREAMAGQAPRGGSWVRFAIMVAVFGAVAGLAIAVRPAAPFILLGIPVVASFSNIFFEDREHDPNRRGGRKRAERGKD